MNTLTGTIRSIKRGTHSRNGNPSWFITMDGSGITYRTESDASWSYAVDASMIGKTFTFTLTRNGRISYAQEIKPRTERPAPSYVPNVESRDYVVKTYADGFGVWHARITFPNGGAGNTGEGEALIDRAKRAARRAIREELIGRGMDSSVRLRYAIVSNRENGAGALASLVIAEA